MKSAQMNTQTQPMGSPKKILAVVFPFRCQFIIMKITNLWRSLWRYSSRLTGSAFRRARHCLCLSAAVCGIWTYRGLQIFKLTLNILYFESISIGRKVEEQKSFCNDVIWIQSCCMPVYRNNSKPSFDIDIIKYTICIQKKDVDRI